MTESTDITITGSSFSSSVSDTKVKIGGEDCSVQTASSSEITCTVGRLPVGNNNVYVYVGNDGRAASTAQIESSKVAQIDLPAMSSEHGGAELVISGNGFVNGATTVDVGGTDCPVTSVNFGEVIIKQFF